MNHKLSEQAKAKRQALRDQFQRESQLIEEAEPIVQQLDEMNPGHKHHVLILHHAKDGSITFGFGYHDQDRNAHAINQYYVYQDGLIARMEG